MLKRILLLKPWGDHSAGEIVQVDPVRAGRLILEGVGTEPEDVDKVRAVPPDPSDDAAHYLRKGKPKA